MTSGTNSYKNIKYISFDGDRIQIVRDQQITEEFQPSIHGCDCIRELLQTTGRIAASVSVEDISIEDQLSAHDEFNKLKAMYQSVLQSFVPFALAHIVTYISDVCKIISTSYMERGLRFKLSFRELADFEEFLARLTGYSIQRSIYDALSRSVKKSLNIEIVEEEHTRNMQVLSLMKKSYCIQALIPLDDFIALCRDPVRSINVFFNVVKHGKDVVKNDNDLQVRAQQQAGDVDEFISLTDRNPKVMRNLYRHLAGCQAQTPYCSTCSESSLIRGIVDDLLHCHFCWNLTSEHYVILPCLHCGGCLPCIRKMDRCPECREPIQKNDGYKKSRLRQTLWEMFEAKQICSGVLHDQTVRISVDYSKETVREDMPMMEYGLQYYQAPTVFHWATKGHPLGNETDSTSTDSVDEQIRERSTPVAGTVRDPCVVEASHSVFSLPLENGDGKNNKIKKVDSSNGLTVNQLMTSSPSARNHVVERNGADAVSLHDGFYDCWTNIGPAIAVNRVGRRSAEYKRVAKALRLSSGQNSKIKVKMILRIQNRYIWKEYQAHKERVTAELDGLQVPVDRELWYYPDHESVDDISKSNFERKKVSRFGSHMDGGYTFYVQNRPYPRQAEQRILLAKVITGRYVMIARARDADHMDLPYKQHSIADNTVAPTTFSVYHDAAVYPAYEIVYSVITA